MLEAFGNHPQGQGLDFGHCFTAVRTVAEHTRQRGHLGEPAAVVFPLKFDRKGHGFTLHPIDKRLQPSARGGILSAPQLNRGH